MQWAFASVLVGLLSVTSASAQETRSMIFGRVLDPQTSAVAGAQVSVTNTDTNVSIPVTTNSTGYYEARLLLPGNYQVSAQAAGFKKAVRQGILLPVSTQSEINITLELGAVSDTVTVSADAALVDTSTASSGRVIDSTTRAGVPVSSANITVFARLVPGVQSNGEVRVLRPGDQGSSSDYRINGNVGGNEWNVDGVSNNGSNGRTVGYLPHADEISEMKVETSGFDASMGHATGVFVSLMTKSGTNGYHGSASNIHEQTRWNATPFFTRQLYYKNIAAADAAGNRTLADQLRGSEKQLSGRYNHYNGTFGGPVYIPKVINGRDKLFFFVSYTGIRRLIPPNPINYNWTFPTVANRTGDFSQLLLTDASRYQIFDPLTVRPDPLRAGHVTRDPFARNILLPSRFANPAYNTYNKIMPIPNNDPIDPKQEPLNNFLGTEIPWTTTYHAITNRVDYQLNSKHRFYGRWTIDHYTLDPNDWAWRTQPGLMSTPDARDNISGIVDWVWTANASTMIDLSFGMNQYAGGAINQASKQFPPSQIGLPAYLDQRAGVDAIFPVMNVGVYSRLGVPLSSVTRFRNGHARLDISHVRGKHTLRGGFETRRQYRTGGGGGNTTGAYGFDATFTQRTDDGFMPAGSLGHSWAAFMMGLPTSIGQDFNATYATQSPYYAWHFQDNFRINSRLTVNLGIRAEFENGVTERYNRMIGPFDPAAALPIAAAAQAAYAQSPVPELAASNFVVRGGATYPGVDGADSRLWKGELSWMPRAAVAWELGPHTVMRAGYGMFFDSINALIDPPNQFGFSRTTSSVVTTDFGQTWLVGDPRNGVSPLRDPFPVRADGTRFDTPPQAALGVMAVAGRAFSYPVFGLQRARQQRWRAGVQHQLGTKMLVEVAYSGSYSDRVAVARTLGALPEQYWASGLTRNDAIATNLNSNVNNPFFIGNFADLARTSPVVYQNMSTLAFFTSRTARKNQLLRPFPEMSALTQSNAPVGDVRTHGLEVSLERRFSKGISFFVAYSRTSAQTADIFLNEFDAAPSSRESNFSRPHRLVFTGIWELPFGRGRAFAQRGVANWLAGGWQLGGAYEAQPGPLLDFGNLFYYGDPSQINSGPRTFDRWFNTDNFERSAARAPAAFHRRVFPTRIDGLRADYTNCINANLQRDFRFLEHKGFQVRMEVLNLTNRTQFGAPETNPLSTNFGTVTIQSQTNRRTIQLQGRFYF